MATGTQPSDLPLTVQAAASGVGEATITITWASPPKPAPSHYYIVAILTEQIMGSTIETVTECRFTPGPAGGKAKSAPLTAVLNGLRNGGHYKFVVRFPIHIGEGVEEEVLIEASDPITMPSAPAIQPNTPTVSSPGPGKVLVAWTAIADPTITDYIVTAALLDQHGIPTGTAVEQWAGSAATSTGLSGLTDGSQYAFTVSALNACGRGASSGMTAYTLPPVHIVQSAEDIINQLLAASKKPPLLPEVFNTYLTTDAAQKLKSLSSKGVALSNHETTTLMGNWEHDIATLVVQEDTNGKDELHRLNSLALTFKMRGVLDGYYKDLATVLNGQAATGDEL